MGVAVLFAVIAAGIWAVDKYASTATTPVKSIATPTGTWTPTSGVCVNATGGLVAC